MDSTFIQEIANQLGIVVDDVNVLIKQYLPQYANLQILYNVISAIMWVTFIIVAVIMAYKIFIHQQHNHCGDYCTITIVVSIIIITFFIINLVCNVGNTIGWAIFPEASLIDTVFDCVKE